MVAHNWTEHKTQQPLIRFCFLGLPVVLALAFAIPLLIMGMYNFTGVFSCFIEEYPLHCSIEPERWGECTRGANATALQGGLFIFVGFCTVIILVFMALLVRTVRKQEKAGDRYVSLLFTHICWQD